MTAIIASTVNVKTMADDTLRLTIDIDPQYAHEAFMLFGKRGSACAIARLTNEAAVESMRIENSQNLDTSLEPVQKSQESMHKGGPLAKLAGMWCNDPKFWEWIRPVFDHHVGGDGTGWAGYTKPKDKEALNWFAAEAVRVLCCVDSRAELDFDKYAETRFHTLIREPYAEYLRSEPAIREAA